MDQERQRRQFERSHDPARLMALTDGVFAIVITLLVLEIHVRSCREVNDSPRRSVRSDPRSSRSSASSSRRYSWTAHRDLFAHIRLTDRNLVWLNLLYMLPLSLLPFGAA